MPTSRAASTRFVPSGTSTVRSSIVTLGTVCSITEIAPLGERTAATVDVLVDLLLEVLDQRLHGPDRRVPQRAERVAADVLADREEELRVAVAPLAVLEAPQQQLEPVRPFAAGRALAARLVV